MSDRKVRVRFAPSPTGPLHIGGVRTALYNYLFARQHGGDLVFRIEDTDSHRFVPGAEDYIIESFRWLGIKFDEGVSFGGNHGPYRQSERRGIYKKYVEQLLEAGKAYIAFDTPEQLEAKRAEIQNFQYDARTRGEMCNSLTLSKEEVEQRIADGQQYVVRFKIEPGIEVHVNDMIRGDVKIKSDILDDKVLYKSADELPTYHLANIVDDHLMRLATLFVARSGCQVPHFMFCCIVLLDGKTLCLHLPTCHCCSSQKVRASCLSVMATALVSQYSHWSGTILRQAMYLQDIVRAATSQRL